MKHSGQQKTQKFPIIIVVILISLCAYTSAKCYCLEDKLKSLQNNILLMDTRLDNIETDFPSPKGEIQSSYNLADHVSSALGIITAGITVFTLFGGILTIFNISRAKELDEAITKAEKALENQQELIGARLLQDGLVYISRHRPYYAVKAFEKVIYQVPNTTAALTARYEILSLYTDTRNTQIDSYRFLMVRKKFDEFIDVLSKANGKIDPDVYRNLHGDAYFALGCFCGEYASTLSFGINYTNAAEWYINMALKDNSLDADYHRNLAYTYAMAGKKNHCRKALESAFDCAKREPLYGAQVSESRLQALFSKIWDKLPGDIQKMLEEFFPAPKLP